MSSSLPTPAEFMAGFMDAPTAKKEMMRPLEPSPEIPGVSQEFRALIVQYCASLVAATSLAEVRWEALAKRLGTQKEFLAEAASAIDAGGALWNEVIAARIKTAAASRVFRDNSWEKLESLAVNRLVQLAEKNMIRDPGELLAVASAARRANTAGEGGTGGNQTNVNINLGDGAVGENGLPAAGSKMTIDLSPRVASALASRANAQAPVGNRVIDGDMLSASELRSVLEAKTNPPQADEDGSQSFEGDES
jgi:hypothetical protein